MKVKTAVPQKAFGHAEKSAFLVAQSEDLYVFCADFNEDLFASHCSL